MCSALNDLLYRLDLDTMWHKGLVKTVTFVGSSAEECAATIKREYTFTPETGWKVLWRPANSAKFVLFAATPPGGKTDWDLEAIEA